MSERLSPAIDGKIPGITGIGAATGRRTVDNNAIAEMLERPPKVIQRMMRRVGIQTRQWAEDNIATSDLAIEAVDKALDMANRHSEDLTAIYVATMSSDHQGVPVAPKVQEKVKTPNMGKYADIGAACAGFIHALDVAYLNLTSRIGAKGPLAAVGAEVLSRHINKKNQDTFILFGDAAGAVIVEAVKDPQNLGKHIAFQFGADGKHAKDLLIEAGGSRFPTSQETLDKGMHVLSMDGPVVKAQGINRMVECSLLALEQSGLSFSDISVLISHQANEEIINGVARQIGFPMERVFKNIQKYGNTSAASIPIALKEAYDEGRLHENEFMLLCSFGAGFTFAAAVIPLVGLPKRSTFQKAKRAIRKIQS